MKIEMKILVQRAATVERDYYVSKKTPVIYLKISILQSLKLKSSNLWQKNANETLNLAR